MEEYNEKLFRAMQDELTDEERSHIVTLKKELDSL